jgi:uncharacterized protein (DUF305 family)
MKTLGFRNLAGTILVPFGAYLLLFVGMGFVSGSIVHLGEVSQIPRYLTIGTVGMVMFILGSYLQEIHINPQKIPLVDLLRYVFYSLFLAIGIGMMSGGTQHFLDFPRYASYLLPGGFLLAAVAYVLRNRFSLSLRAWNVLLIGVLAIALPVFLGLSHYASGLGTSTGHSHGEAASMETQAMGTEAKPHVAGHGEAGGSGHSNHIGNEIDFLIQMIPHHQEAVESSAYLLTRTADPVLQTFLQRVIQVQSREVTQMQQWHQQWTGTAYVPTDAYAPMMGNLSSKEGPALEQAYLEGMVGHHGGAIAMAQQVQSLTQRPELKQFAAAMIQTQTAEVAQLKHWQGDRAVGGGSHPH